MAALDQSWPPSPQSPADLELPMTSKFEAGLLLLPDVSSVSSGALTPDVRSNCPPSFRTSPSPLSSEALASSDVGMVLKVGNYLLTERLADMPSGVAVYRAVNAITGELFICKVIPADRCQTILQPYTVVPAHFNIGGVHEVVMGSSYAYAMHPAPTEDLHAYVRRCRRLSEKEAAGLFRQILNAVNHCHNHGVVIRDIKLRRFQFSDNERTLLRLDGLYDVVILNGYDDRLTDKHGCLAYVSPEILDATFSPPSSSSSSCFTEPVSYSGRAADAWSLGVVLYTMLFGRYPFADSDARALFTRIRRGHYPTPTDVVLSPLARCLVRGLLTVNPDDRLSVEDALSHPWFDAVDAAAESRHYPFFVTPSSSSSSLVKHNDDCTVPQMIVEQQGDDYGDV